MKVLEPEFYERAAAEVASDLLGKMIVSTVDGLLCAGRIVETEAYIGPDDEASHAAARIGRTARNEALFGTPGLAYVYRIYGVHWCVNAVSDRRDFPSGVLIRAAEPVEGIDVATARRGDRPLRDLMRGPGNLGRALGITGALNLHDLTLPPLQIFDGPSVPRSRIVRGPRVGITRSVDLPLRFWVQKSPFVSRGPKPLSP